MLNIKRFSNDEDGAVTVDWIVLTAALVGLATAAGLAFLNVVDTGSAQITTDVLN